MDWPGTNSAGKQHDTKDEENHLAQASNGGGFRSLSEHNGTGPAAVLLGQHGDLHPAAQEVVSMVLYGSHRMIGRVGASLQVEACRYKALLP